MYSPRRIIYLRPRDQPLLDARQPARRAANWGVLAQRARPVRRLARGAGGCERKPRSARTPTARERRRTGGFVLYAPRLGALRHEAEVIICFIS